MSIYSISNLISNSFFFFSYPILIKVSRLNFCIKLLNWSIFLSISLIYVWQFFIFCFIGSALKGFSLFIDYINNTLSPLQVSISSTKPLMFFLNFRYPSTSCLIASNWLYFRDWSCPNKLVSIYCKQARSSLPMLNTFSSLLKKYSLIESKILEISFSMILFCKLISDSFCL